MTENPRRGLRPLLSAVVLRSQSDARLAGLARTGSQGAFEAIYERYRRELAAHAGRIVRADRVEDVVQHAMLAAWSGLLAGGQISDLRAWLHRVVHNAALDTVGRRGYADSRIPDTGIGSARTDELAESRLDARAALAAIAALPESQRRALTLTALEGRSGEDAAAEMGISESAMRQLVYRARCGVRSTITALTPWPIANWMVGSADSPAGNAALSLAGGSAAGIVAKAAVVVGVGAATVGATQVLHEHHRQQAHVSHASVAQPRDSSAARLGAANEQAPAGAQEQLVTDSGGSGRSTGNDGGSGNAGSGDANQQAGTQQHEGAQNPTQAGGTTAGHNTASQTGQAGPTNGGTQSGQSGVPSGRKSVSAPQGGQAGQGGQTSQAGRGGQTSQAGANTQAGPTSQASQAGPTGPAGNGNQ